VLCENYPRSAHQFARTMKHELVHAYDLCRVEYAPKSCLHNACTEIRAANLSGDCNLSMEILRGRGWKYMAHKQDCVKNQAATSVAWNPSCAENAQRSVELAFKDCWADTSPFDHIP
jgi:inner membrane protease ATP23